MIRWTAVLADPEAVKATATWVEPGQHPEGFDFIFVNGRVAVASGELAPTILPVLAGFCANRSTGFGRS